MRAWSDPRGIMARHASIAIAAADLMGRVVRRVVMIGAIALASACSIFDKNESPTAPSAPDATQPIRYTALGASDAIGFGGSVSCVPFTQCETGTGYVQVLTRRLRASRQVTLSNLGIPASVLSPTIYAIARQHGRDVPANFIDHEMPFVPPESTLVTIFGGGNDTNALGEAIERGAAGSNIAGYVDTQVSAFGTDVDRLVRTIRTQAPGAFVVILNVPNMAGLPYAAGLSLPQRQLLQKIAVGFSREINRQAGAGVVIVDLMCDSQVYLPSRFASDGFHPNDAGYDYMAERLLTVVNGGSSNASASCSQMTIVPN